MTDKGQTAFAFVGIGADDFDVAALGIFQNLIGLVVGRVLLVLGGHAHVLRNKPTPLQIKLERAKYFL